MTRRTIKIFLEGISSKAPRKIYNTNKIDAYRLDDSWSFDVLGSKDFSPENIRGYRFILLKLDNFSNFDWTVPLKKNLSNHENLF